ncbi:MAG: epimerase [Chloroflexi bacterium]|nr:UDP-N-acetylglucosamine 4-epimerase [Anaerolineales bacterium]MCQ3954866.1 epimerase [Chloroflexota bacterium]MDL1920465.1 NAD-dependent epimerase/dehydratase family protein [Chloroflexi bacterium CFX5]MCK6566543.1 NAD-dependent epimerase/dehydratase family protein [Anaerolineales bacterium]NUQ60763.1 NAD-dependent epimerase/dehydratase family protein [Anaerolineales bacterium]
MNFLITGAAGFLGSSLANHLAREGHQVRGLDDLSTGDPKVLAPDVHFTRGDVSDRPKLWTLLQDVDVVYHLAARVSVQESILYPRDYNAVNVGGTVALMEAMRDVGVKRVALASSGAVYGDMTDGSLKESDIPNPRSPYAVSKIAAEHYVRAIGNLWNIETVSLRIFNAYGPNQHLPPSHPPVVPHYLRQALRGGTLVAHGDGSQTRDYIYVDDAISAMVAASTAPNINGLVINVGSGVETSIKGLIRVVLDVTDSKSNVVYNTQTSAGVSRMKADLTLAKEKLRFTPSIGLEDGLRLTLQRDSRFK